jgi:FdhD protein
MDAVEEVPIRRFDAGRQAAAADTVVNEARIELDVGEGRHRLTMLCLPQDLDALAVGFLRCEGALRHREDLASVDVPPDGRRVSVRGDFDADALDALARRWTRGSGCGDGGTARDLDAPPYAPVGPGRPIGPGRLIELAKALQRAGRLWRRTGGVHACALACEEGIVAFAEDVGRHNAFDKVMGRALLDGVDVSDKLVLTTGRLSAEIVSKAVACGVAMLASRSAVTGLAVRLARRFGVTLVGFLRGRRLNVYTGFERIAAGRAEDDT